MAWINKRIGKNGVVSWRVQVRPVNAPSISRTFRSHKGAKAFEATLTQQMYKDRTGALISLNGYTVQDMIERYRKEVHIDKAPQTQRTTKHIIQYWSSRLGNIQLNRLDSSRIMDETQMLSETRKPITVRKYFIILNHMLTYASIHWDWISK